MNTLTETADALLSHAPLLVTAHEYPDGDALGAALALSRILGGAGIEIQAVGLQPIAQRYDFLPREGEILDPASLDASAAGALVVLDCGDIQQALPFVSEWRVRTTLINIDHHVSNAGFGDINYVDASASSVGEIVWKIAAARSFPVSPEAAVALWTALVTDTGRFLHSNTTPSALTMAAGLIEAGVEPAEVNHLIYQRATLKEIRLQQRAMERLQVLEAGKVAVVSLTQADLAELDASRKDCEDIVDIPRSLRGVEVALFLYQPEDAMKTKVSVRTVAPHDAAELCQAFGGGGHPRAAGCRIDRDLPSALKDILGRVRAMWQQATPG